MDQKSKTINRCQISGIKDLKSILSLGYLPPVNKLKKNIISCRLKLPVCAALDSRVTISRMISNRFRLIGYGIIKG